VPRETEEKGERRERGSRAPDLLLDAGFEKLEKKATNEWNSLSVRIWEPSPFSLFLLLLFLLGSFHLPFCLLSLTSLPFLFATVTRLMM
jgi:hypothetical protein